MTLAFDRCLSLTIIFFYLESWADLHQSSSLPGLPFLSQFPPFPNKLFSCHPLVNTSRLYLQLWQGKLVLSTCLYHALGLGSISNIHGNSLRVDTAWCPLPIVSQIPRNHKWWLVTTWCSRKERMLLFSLVPTIPVSWRGQSQISASGSCGWSQQSPAWCCAGHLHVCQLWPEAPHTVAKRERSRCIWAFTC